jgi:cytochrome c oxidase subunit 3
MSTSVSLPTKSHNRKPSNIALAMAIYLISTVMLFVGLFVSYFFVRGTAPYALALTKPTLLTVLSLASLAPLALAQRALHRNQPRRAMLGLALTAALGIVFLGVTVWEYLTLGFSYRDSTFASAFYMLSSFHALHVFAGLIMLATVSVGVQQGLITARRGSGLLAVTVYWLIIQLIWLLVYLIVYIL